MTVKTILIRLALNWTKNINTKTIQQQLEFNINPDVIYEILMDSGKHSLLTGDEAVISREVGGKFTAFGGYSEGTNLELVAGKKIVQTWRAGDWPEGHYSEITVSLSPIEKGTRLDFIQTGVPEDQYDDISSGWYDFYWTP